MYRITKKNGEMRNLEIWNIATDAIINANLERDGFKIKDGYINMPEALQYNAEEFYEKLLKENHIQNQQAKSNNNQTTRDTDHKKQSGQNSNDQMMDDHSLWEKAFKESKQNNEQKQDYQIPKINDQSQSKNNHKKVESNFDEKFEFQENRLERREIAKQKFNKMREQELKKVDSGNIELGDVGHAKPILDWRLLLRREIEKTETIWSQRRSIAENNYAYRLEENDIDEEAQTEVMIDVSGSVSLEMVKAFLRQLKPMLKESKLKVGCFNEKFWGMVEIKSNHDVDSFKIPQDARGSSAWTENWDLAVRSFTKKREINKIVFTDGEPCPGTMPKSDLKGTNVIWLVYSNRSFKPCCGKVIQISEQDLKRLSLNNNEKPKTDEWIL